MITPAEFEKLLDEYTDRLVEDNFESVVSDKMREQILAAYREACEAVKEEKNDVEG